MPIEGVVLQMKSMHIDSVVNFPFPTPPDRLSLSKAEKVLTHLGALTTLESSVAVVGGQITEVGKAMSLFPLSPRYSRMLVSGRQHGCLPYVIAIVSALSVGDPFLREEALEQDDESSDEDTDMSHIQSEAVKAKEARRLRRKAFFESQAVSSTVLRPRRDFLTRRVDPCLIRRSQQRHFPRIVRCRCIRVCWWRAQILCRPLR